MRKNNDELLAYLFILYCSIELLKVSVIQIQDLMKVKREMKRAMNRLAKSAKVKGGVIYHNIPREVKEQFDDSCYDNVALGTEILADAIMVPPAQMNWVKS